MDSHNTSILISIDSQLRAESDQSPRNDKPQRRYFFEVQIIIKWEITINVLMVKGTQYCRKEYKT